MAVTHTAGRAGGSAEWLLLEPAGKRSIDKFIFAEAGELIAYYPHRVDDSEFAVKVVEKDSGTTRAVLHTAESVTGINMIPSLQFSPDGSCLAVILDEYAGSVVSESEIKSRVTRLFDTDTWEQSLRISGPASVYRDIRVANATAWCFSKGSDRIAVVFGETIRVHNVTTGRQGWEITSDGPETVRCLAWTANDSKLFVGDDQGTLRVFDLASGKPDQVINGLGDLQELRVMPNGLLIATSNHGYAGNQTRDRTCWALSKEGLLHERLWTREDGVLHTNGEVLMIREDISLPAPPTHRTHVSAYVFYKAAAKDDWWDMLPESRRLLDVSSLPRFQLQFAGNYLVAPCGFGQFLAVDRQERTAVVIGETEMVGPPSFVPTASLEDFGSIIGNLGARVLVK